MGCWWGRGKEYVRGGVREDRKGEEERREGDIARILLMHPGWLSLYLHSVLSPVKELNSPNVGEYGVFIVLHHIVCHNRGKMGTL